MINWRRRNEGFEWREYVRTTILVRRKERRQRVHEIKAAAVAGVKEAGRRGLDAGASGASAAGRGMVASLKAAGAMTFEAVRALARSLGPGLAAISNRLRKTMESAQDALAPSAAPLLARLRTPRIKLALKIAAPLAAAASIYRWQSFGLDADVIVAGGLAAAAALVLLLLAVTDPDRHSTTSARLSDRLARSLAALPDVSAWPRKGTLLAALALLAIALVATWILAAPQQIEASKERPGNYKSETATLDGRATAISGARLRISGTEVRLLGIDPPEPEQTCLRENGSVYRCGVEAKDELSRLVRGRRVTCEIAGSDETGRMRGTCRAAGDDLAEKMVRNGHVFAEQGFFAPYSDAEAKARDTRAGLWSGTPERPDEWRAKKWEEAKRTAPDGCPIKGRITAGSRIYLLPWSASYESVRLSKARGERWFCSESEAQEAGWRAASPS